MLGDLGQRLIWHLMQEKSLPMVLIGSDVIVHSSRASGGRVLFTLQMPDGLEDVNAEAQHPNEE